MSEDLEVVIPNPSPRLIFGCRPSITATSILALDPLFLTSNNHCMQHLPTLLGKADMS
jgi:hypothetical protein